MIKLWTLLKRCLKCEFCFIYEESMCIFAILENVSRCQML